MTKDIVITKDIDFFYKSHYDEGAQGVWALKGMNISIPQGQFVVIIGRNGSGKSTFARLLNALQLPTNGTVYINGFNTKDKARLWDIRRSAGMVFQNPDNQIIGTTVEEDVAFGPENTGIEPAEIRKRVDESLQTVGIPEYSEHAPHLLSGGQKQRVAIAGILAMKPECIILDEATAMLDPVGRKEVLEVLRKLNCDEKITIIHITHHMDEIAQADRVIIIDDGSVIMDGKPKRVFSKVQEIKALGLDVPHITQLLYDLNMEGYDLPHDILGVDEACEAILGLMIKRRQ